MAGKSAVKISKRAPDSVTSRPAALRAKSVGSVERVDGSHTDPTPGSHTDPTPAPAPRSEGQRLLALVPGSLQQVGDAIGATRQAVAWWRNGSRTPEERWRVKLQARFGIPIAAWDRVAGDAPAAAAVEWFPSPADGGEPSALEDCGRLLALLRSQLNRPDLLGRERVQLGDAFARALAQKERLERAREMLEARTIREHPEWQRLKRLMIAALLPFPEASRAVEAALVKVLGDGE